MIFINDIFIQIKSRISITEACTAYGIKTERRSSDKLFACCPFHNEKTASFAIYPETNSFYCYGCGVGGDSVVLVQKLFNLDPLEAAKKINEDFNLGIETGKPLDNERIQAANEERELIKRLEEWIDNAYIALCDYFHLLRDFKAVYKPTSPSLIDIRYIEACHNYDYIEHLIDILIIADFKMQVQFFKAYTEI